MCPLTLRWQRESPAPFPLPSAPCPHPATDLDQPVRGPSLPDSTLVRIKRDRHAVPVLPLWLNAAAALIVMAVLVVALLGIDSRRLRDLEAQAVFFALLALSVSARLGRIELQPGLDLHLFGASIAALMLGWRFAALLQMLAVALVALLWQRYWLSLPLDLLITGLLPVLVTTALLDFAQKRMPAHLFVYLLFNAFLAGALSIALAHVGKLLILLALGGFDLDTLGENFLLTVPALMFPEGFATGAVLTLAVAYRPRWVATFHDPSYLDFGSRH